MFSLLGGGGGNSPLLRLGGGGGIGLFDLGGGGGAGELFLFERCEFRLGQGSKNEPKIFSLIFSTNSTNQRIIFFNEKNIFWSPGLGDEPWKLLLGGGGGG